MKCDFCVWQHSPDSLPMIDRHINGNHWGLEDYEVVSREGEIMIVKEVEDEDIMLPFEKPVFTVAEVPEIVEYPYSVDASVDGVISS